MVRLLSVLPRGSVARWFLDGRQADTSHHILSGRWLARLRAQLPRILSRDSSCQPVQQQGGPLDLDGQRREIGRFGGRMPAVAP